jgi:hypothetical protein
MCGIVGAIGTGIDASLLHSIFLESEDRGKHATGFWFPNTGIVKAPKSATVFLNENAETFMQGATESQIFLGHTRYATHGRPENNFNSQPLESENWIMVHNGIVATMKDMNDYPYKSDSDTENLLAYIERFGIEEGLSYCNSGAAILFINKAKEGELYLWKTYTQPIQLGYDMSNETIYICSESKFIWEALKPELKEEKILGGLFRHVTMERKMKVAEPKSRDLWKISLKDNKLKSDLVCTVENKAVKSSCGFTGNNWNYHTGYQKGGCSIYPVEEKGKEIFVGNREGKHRPRVIAMIARQKEIAKTAAATNTVTKTKGDSTGVAAFMPQDIVRLKRKPQYADEISGGQQGAAILGLTTQDTFSVRKYMTNDRVAIENIYGILYVMPAKILTLAEPPVCVGLSYDSNSSRCESCHWHLDCAAVHYSYDGLVDVMPECLGDFEAKDDECATCEFLTPCLANLGKNNKKPDENEEYINAEFQEANEELTKEK